MLQYFSSGGHLRIYASNTLKNPINSLLCWSVTVLIFIQTLQSLQLAGRYLGDFGNFFSAHACFDRPEYWMSAIYISKLWNSAFCQRSVWQKQRLIVLFHLRLSDVMYKKYKRLVYTPPDLLARFCKANLSNGKNSAGFAFQVFVFQA